MRIEDGPWSRWTDLSGGAEVMGRVTFDAKVAWVRTASARVVTRYADGSVDDGAWRPELDRREFGSGVATLLRDARRRARRLGAAPGTVVAVEVLCRVADVPMLDDGRDANDDGSHDLLILPDDWLRPDDPWLAAMAAAGPDADEVSTPSPRYVAWTEVCDVPVWSSAMNEDRDEPETALDRAQEALAATLPDGERQAFGERWLSWRSADRGGVGRD